MSKTLRKITALICIAALMMSLCISLPFTVSAATVGVTVNNNGYVSTVNATVGTLLSEPEHSDEIDFLGWYSDVSLTEEFGVVKPNETRTAYAKYNKTVISFEGKTDYTADVQYRDDASRFSNAFTSGVVTDPTNANNKVFELHAPGIYANLCLPKYDAQGASSFILASNKTYVITAKFMIPESVSVSSFEIRMNKGDASKTVGSYTAGRTGIEEVKKTYTVVKSETGAANEVVAGKWYTYTATYNFGDTSRQTSPQLAINFGAIGTADFGKKNYIYFDDVTIYNVADGIVADSATHSGFETAVMRHDSSMNSTTAATITGEQARSGAKSLKIAAGGSAHYKSYVYNGDKSALKFDTYTRYEVTFYYKAKTVENSVNIILTKHYADNVWGANAAELYRVSAAKANNEWQKCTFTVYSGAETEYIYLGVGIEGASSGDVVYFDDFSITKLGNYDYLCDFSADFTEYPRKDAGGAVVDGNGVITNSSTNGTHPNYYSSHTMWSINDGILTYPTSNTTAHSTSGEAWIQHFVAKDTVNKTPNFKFVNGETYHITVRYKQTTTAPDAVGSLSIVAKAAELNQSKALRAIWTNKAIGNTDWQTVSYTFTCGSEYADKYLTLAFGTTSGTATFDVDYVAVSTGVKTNNNGTVSYVHGLSKGDTIPAPEHSDDVTFIGWYSDPECTVEYGTVNSNENRTAYARYNKTVITFTEKGYETYRTFNGYNSGIVADPLDASNNVFKMACSNAWGNVALSTYDAIGAKAYTLSQGCTYKVTFKFMLPDEVIGDNDKIKLRLLNGSASVNAILYSTEHTYDVSNLKAYTWYTFSGEFTASDLSKGDYLKISMGYDTTTANKDADDFVYVDDVVIFNTSEFVDVTINDNGLIYTENIMVGKTLEALESTDEQKFIGWYEDADFTTAFGAVKANETRTAYAKYDNTKIAFDNVGGLSASNGVSHAADTANTSNMVVKVEADSTVKSFIVPNYDAKTVDGYKVSAGKTYVVRFKVKTADGTNGTIKINGNAFKFDATSSWLPAAITFTAAENGVIKMDVATATAFNVYIDNLYIYEFTETPTASVTAGSSTVTVSKPTAKNNYLNGTITVNLANNEQVKINGLKITYDLYATAFSETVTHNVFTAQGGYDDDRDANAGNGLVYVYNVPANAKNIKVTAEFTTDANGNFGIIASSIREKSETNTTGIRFRGRIYNQNNIKNVGFIVTPKALIPAGKVLTLETAEECHAITAIATGVVYDYNDVYTDYQLLLKGDNLDKLKDVQMYCVIYIEYEDGTISYGIPKTTSYNEVYDMTNASYYGITSYYSEEYADTRAKLTNSQNADTFSFIVLSDTHIDYTFTLDKSNGGQYWYLGQSGETYVERHVIEREIAAVIEMANTTDVDCVILGGDLIHGTSSYAKSVADLEYFAEMFKKCHVPVLANRGNHDTNDYHNLSNNKTKVENVIDQATWNDILVDDLSKNTAVHDKNNPESTYYYVDFESKKTRLIVLDAYNYPVLADANGYSVWRAETWTGMEDAQLRWLAQVALDAEKQGWTYVLSCHAPIVGPETFGNSGLVQKIVTAFNNKTTTTVNGWTVDYTNATGNIPFSVSGHTHISSTRYFEDADHIAINTGSGKISYYPQKDYTDTDTVTYQQNVRYEGDYTEALFDAITYNKNGTVSRICFGANTDEVYEKSDYVK